MLNILLATALSLHPGTVDTTRITVIPPSPVSRIAPAAVQDAKRPMPRLFGFDKVQHFALTYAISSFSFGALRSAGVDTEPALLASAAAAVATGLGKEVFDKRQNRPFSATDLLADALGAVAAYAVLSQTR